VGFQQPDGGEFPHTTSSDKRARVLADVSCSVLRTPSGSADHDSNASIPKNTISRRTDSRNVAVGGKGPAAKGCTTVTVDLQWVVKETHNNSCAGTPSRLSGQDGQLQGIHETSRARVRRTLFA
jgi:hypothetical protein